MITPDHQQPQPTSLSDSSESTTTPSAATIYEEDHVHSIYESIASHFSQTRYKPWPLVAEFLSRQPIGSIGLDAGSGNGKYLHAHNLTHHAPQTQSSPKLPIGAKPPADLLNHEPRYFLIGLDRSRSLLSHSRHPHSHPDLIHADCLGLPFRSSFNFDFAISIATLHHLSTDHRRLEAMKLLLDAVRPSSVTGIGRLLVFVWAHEQGQKSRRIWAKGTLLPAPQILSPESTSDHNTLEQQPADLQDVLVPWVLNHNTSHPDPTAKPMVYNRYYHLFRQGELIDLMKSASQSIGLSFQSGSDTPEPTSAHKRGWCKIKRHGWEADNWWAEAELGCQAC